MPDLRFPLNHAPSQAWAHLGSNQGDARTAYSGVGRQTGRFAGETVEANPGHATRTGAASDPADGHRKDKSPGRLTSLNAERPTLEATPPHKETTYPCHRNHRGELLPAARPRRTLRHPEPEPLAAHPHLPNRPVPRAHHRPGKPLVGPDHQLWWWPQRQRLLRAAASEPRHEDAVGRRGLGHEPGHAASVGSRVCAAAVRVDVRGVVVLAGALMVVTA